MKRLKKSAASENEMEKGGCELVDSFSSPSMPPRVLMLVRALQKKTGVQKREILMIYVCSLQFHNPYSILYSVFHSVVHVKFESVLVQSSDYYWPVSYNLKGFLSFLYRSGFNFLQEVVEISSVSGDDHGANMDYGCAGDGGGCTAPSGLHLHHHGGLPRSLHLHHFGDLLQASQRCLQKMVEEQSQ